ncbi:MAG: cytochrome c oxidase accessory protein CcoG [Arenicellales bacterium]|jgi:cytochrome c oxidase accessory protein FixG
MSSSEPNSPNQEYDSLYAKRKEIYPREVHGIFASWRVAMVTLTLGLYYILPWINWGEGRQALLFDLPNRKFNIFMLTLWPQDLIYLSALLIISALALFLFTTVGGRLWCGYACPQTVWTEVFLWIERKVEGSRPQQMKLAKSPWNMNKIIKKGGKHVIWILFSLWTGFTFVGYFTPIRELMHAVPTWDMGPWESFWIFFYGFATYGNAGWLREQVCIYMCPYARFQSVMFDDNTLIISYDEKRGDPRGTRKRGSDKPTDKGDCIDCSLCVQACPTGIDIRDGLQYQCIACAACIDACDDVMKKMDYDPGLIRYTTLNEISGKGLHIFRPRVYLYTSILIGLILAMSWSLYTRIPVSLDVNRDRNILYREANNGDLENVFKLKIMNQDSKAHKFIITMEGLPGSVLDPDEKEITAASGETANTLVRVRASEDVIKDRSTNITIKVTAVDDEKLTDEEDARFLAPADWFR